MAVTLLDIAKRNAADLSAIVDEATKATPEVTGVSQARTIKGLNYNTLVTTAYPATSGQFRAANQGVAPTKATTINRLVETFVFNPIWEVDRAIADASEDGAAAFIASQADLILKGAMSALSSQFYWGRTFDAAGFPGLSQLVDSGMITNANGTGTCTEVWMVNWGPNTTQWVVGQGGMFSLSNVELFWKNDDSGNPYPIYRQHLLSRIGLAVQHAKAFAKIKNVTSTTKLTDAMLADTIALFPPGMVPSVIYMSRSAQALLRDSRTATNPTGNPAPFPDSAFGIPIEITSGIGDNLTAA